MEKVIKTLFGEDNQIENQFNDLYQEWIRFEDEIESFKKSYKNQNQKNNYYTINLIFFHIL